MKSIYFAITLIVFVVTVVILNDNSLYAQDYFNLSVGYNIINYNSDNQYQWHLGPLGENIDIVITPDGETLYLLDKQDVDGVENSVLRQIDSNGIIIWEKVVNPTVESPASLFVGGNAEVAIAQSFKAPESVVVYDRDGTEVWAKDYDEEDQNRHIIAGIFDGEGNLSIILVSYEPFSTKVVIYDSQGIELSQILYQDAYYAASTIDEEGNLYLTYYSDSDENKSYRIHQLSPLGIDNWVVNIELDDMADFISWLDMTTVLKVDNNHQNIMLVGMNSHCSDDTQKNGKLVEARISMDGEILESWQIPIENPGDVYGIMQDIENNIYLYDIEYSLLKIDYLDGHELWSWDVNEHNFVNQYYEHFCQILGTKVYFSGSYGRIKNNREKGRSEVFYTIYNGTGVLDVKQAIPIMPTLNTYFPSNNCGLLVSEKGDIYLQVETVERAAPVSDEKDDDNDENEEKEGCGC